MPDEPADPLSSFIASQAGRFSPNGASKFYQGFRRLLRYQTFLGVILQRHLPVADALKARMPNVTELVVGCPPPGMPPEFIENQVLSDIAHLDIESFYLFSKIHLDWVSRTLEFYFGRARGISLDSHDDLARKIDLYAAQMGLTPIPETFKMSILQMKKDVSDYRDYFIAHHKNFRTIQGTSVLPNGPVMNIGYTTEYKPQSDQLPISTMPLTDLAKEIIEYMGHFTTYLTANQEKAVFERRSAGS